MKTNLPRLLAVCVIATMVAAPATYAQRNLGKKKGPTSKLYMAEAVGETQIQNGDKIYTARQATAFDAPGTVIVTKAGAHNALVYSNGTGMFVDENTRVEIGRFVQEPFQTDRRERLDTQFEPSISQSNVHVSQGAIGVCTSQLVSGSSMNYSTPHGNVNIRGGKVSIETTPEATHIDLLEGDITVRSSGGRDIGGQILRPGERATITPSPGGGQPTITVGPIPQAALQAADERTQTACNARKTVTFEVIEKKAEEGLDAPEETAPAAAGADGTSQEETTGSAATNATDEAAGADDESDQEIVARPVVPESAPTSVVVSPDRLPGT
ncbi:MAG: FecR domain-containing protein [Verrucomicrobiota bacterium]